MNGEGSLPMNREGQSVAIPEVECRRSPAMENGGILHILHPPTAILGICPIISKSLNDLRCGVLAPIVVPKVCLFLGVIGELELVLGEGEEMLMDVELVRHRLTRLTVSLETC